MCALAVRARTLAGARLGCFCLRSCCGCVCFRRHDTADGAFKERPEHACCLQKERHGCTERREPRLLEHELLQAVVHGPEQELQDDVSQHDRAA
jgi:hypothetical protein